MAGKKLNIDNSIMAAFITGEAEPEAKTAQTPTETAEKMALAPAKKNTREVRLNLLLSLDNKIKLQKMVDREGYKSVNDYINYLIAVAVADEPEPTKAERAAYKKDAEGRKKK